MKLLVTGGHTTPALACIDELVKHKNLDIVFVGRRYNSTREKTLSFEYKEIEKRKLKFIHLAAGRFTRSFFFTTFVNLLRIPLGFLSAFQILLTEKPTRILSFGGYIALPVTFAGWVMQIPIYTHEQTIRPGLANILISFFASKIYLSFPESRGYFRGKNVEVVGNPLRKQIFEVIKKLFSLSSKKSIIYITGGSLGAHAINEHIRNIIAQLLNNYIVIHQTGNVAKYNDYEKLQELRSTLPKEQQENYIARQHFDSDEIGFVYSKADLVIGRSGANTFFELVVLKKPSILIPLPISAYGEQQKQAEVLQKAGVAEVFNQSQSSDELLALIHKMIENKERYHKNFDKIQSLYFPHAVETIVSEILKD